jgi:hypothetical protein
MATRGIRTRAERIAACGGGHATPPGAKVNWTYSRFAGRDEQTTHSVPWCRLSANRSYSPAQYSANLFNPVQWLRSTSTR